MALQNPVAWQADGIAHLLGLQELVYLRFGEGGIAPEALPRPLSPVAVYHRLQHLPPPISAMYIAWSKQRPFTVPKLIEQEEGVVAHGLEVAVVGSPFLLAVHRALRAIQVQDNPAVTRVGLGPADPGGIQPGQCFQILRSGQRLGLKAAHGVGAGGRAVSIPPPGGGPHGRGSEEHTSELQSPCNLVCRLLLEKKKKGKPKTGKIHRQEKLTPEQ